MVEPSAFLTASMRVGKASFSREQIASCSTHGLTLEEFIAPGPEAVERQLPLLQRD
jgi:hypothetical protein